MFGDGFEHCFLGEAEELGLDDERLDLMGEQVAAAALRCAGQSGDDGTDAGTRLDDALRQERGYNLGGGVGIDVGFAAENTDRGKGISGLQLSGDDCTLGSVNNLLEDGDTGPKLDAERNHVCTITASTPFCKLKMRGAGLRASVSR